MSCLHRRSVDSTLTVSSGFKLLWISEGLEKHTDLKKCGAHFDTRLENIKTQSKDDDLTLICQWPLITFISFLLLLM